MSRHRRHRLSTILLMVFCLLFQQMALASFACTMPAMVAGPVEMIADCAAAMDMQGGVTAGSDADASMSHPPLSHPPAPHSMSALCEKHCMPDQTTAAAGSVAATVPAMLLPAPIHVPVVAHAAAAAQCDDDAAIVRSDPPPRLRYCSLLI